MNEAPKQPQADGQHQLEELQGQPGIMQRVGKWARTHVTGALLTLGAGAVALGCSDDAAQNNNSDTISAPDQGVVPKPDGKVIPKADGLEPLQDMKPDSKKIDTVPAKAPEIVKDSIQVDCSATQLCGAGGIEYPFTFQAKDATDWSAQAFLIDKMTGKRILPIQQDTPGSFSPPSGKIVNGKSVEGIKYKTGSKVGSIVQIELTIKGPGGQALQTKDIDLH